MQPGETERRLAELGVELPALRPAAGRYVGAVRTGYLLFLSGQAADGWTGRVGDDLTLDDGRTAARACALNLLAQARAELGSLDRIERLVKLTGFVACAEGFKHLPQVVDAASELLEQVLGERGAHARSALGMQALPLGFAVELELVAEVAAGSI